MKKYFFTFLIFNSLFLICFSQLPDTDIWLLDISDSAGQIKLSNPTNVTNRKGYDNQPSFSPDGKYILFTSVRDSTEQADIYRYDLKTKQTTQFTKTTTSEYSPTFMPDGKNISVVMVEKDSAQRLWKFPIKGGVPSCIMPNVDSVGYHCWLTKDSLALFILTNPFTMQVVNVNSQKPTVIAKNIGRGIVKDPTRDSPLFLFVSKEDSTQWQIKSIYSDGRRHKMYEYSSPFKAEDFAFCYPYFSTIVLANGSKLYSVYLVLRLQNEIVDLSSLGIKNITRIAISADGKKMAIVCTSN